MYGRSSRFSFVAALWIAGCLPVTYAADVQVQVGNIYFDPRNVTINVNDQVVWTWVAGGHTTTHSGNPPLWNSGYRTSGTFSRVFDTVGSFPYPGGTVSQVEFFRDTTSLGIVTTSPYSTNVNNLAAGTYTISAVATDNLAAKATNSITLIVNARPTVSIVTPTNGSIFAAPATIGIAANAADSDGSVTQVQFFTNSAPLSIDTTAPYQATPANLPAGTYSLLAVATDNRNATGTSSVASISVVTPVAIVLSGPQFLSSTQFQFRYTANPGLRYVVERSPILTNWTGVTTNTAIDGSELFTDEIGANRSFYRVGCLPNP